jgi:DNA-binding transcriptional LysR family regulator
MTKFGACIVRINCAFSDLDAFLTIKEAGSSNLAAVKENLSQAATTRRVKMLGVIFTSQLFQRNTTAEPSRGHFI